MCDRKTTLERLEIQEDKVRSFEWFAIRKNDMPDSHRETQEVENRDLDK